MRALTTGGRHTAALLTALALGGALLSPSASFAQTTTPAPAAATPQEQPADTGTSTPPQPPQPVMQQAALDLLKKMSDTLAAAQTFSVDVRDMREVRTTPGQMMTLISDATITVQRPNKLRVEAVLGAVDTLMTYDGAKFSVLDKPKNLYVSIDAPKTLDETLETVARRHGIQLAMSDVLVSDPYALLSAGLVNAYVAGDVTLGGTATKQLIFSAPGIEFQIWVDTETSLPVMMTETYLSGRRPVHFMMEFSDWNLDPKPPAEAFAFAPPAGAKPIKFLLAR